MIIIGNYVPVFRFSLSTMHANGLEGQEVYNNQSPVVRCHLGRTNLISSISHLEDLQIFVQYALHYGSSQPTMKATCGQFGTMSERKVQPQITVCLMLKNESTSTILDSLQNRKLKCKLHTDTHIIAIAKPKLMGVIFN